MKKKNPALMVALGKMAVQKTFGTTKRKNPSFRLPAGSVEIYGRLLRIEAQKGAGHVCDYSCKRVNHCYYHDFTKHARVWGLPDGSLLIKDKSSE
jgi:hypothetical protein